MDYLKRNKFKLIIGGAIIFIIVALIIFAGREADRTNRELLAPFTVRLAEEPEELEPPETSLEERLQQAEETEPEVIEETPQETPEATKEPEEIVIADYFPTAGVVFKDEYGFYPKTKNIKSGQRVTWVNQSSELIVLNQRIKMQKDFENIFIYPGESYETIIEGYGYWTFENTQTGDTARFFIY